MLFNSPSLKIQGIDAFVSPHEIFFLGHQDESSLQDLILKNILLFNFSKNARYRDRPPAQFIIGMDLLKTTFESNHIKRLPHRTTILSTSPIPEAILEGICQEAAYRRPACIILSGFNNIDFSKQSIADRKNDIESFLHQLRKIQKRFTLPILISTKIKIQNIESITCVPQLESNDAEFVIATDRYYSLTVAEGVFRLYHVVRNSATTVSCISYEDLADVKHT